MNLNYRAFAAEFLGTFSLAFAVLISIHSPDFPVPTPLIAALTVGLFVYTVGPISGTHINPAVTIGLFVIQKIDFKNAIGYLVSQILAAFAACAAGGYLLGISLERTNSAPLDSQTAMVFGLAELIGAFFLVFGVSSVVLEKVSEALSGIVIGASLLLGISIASITSAGILNPAVALTLHSCSLPYLLGPIIGGIIGALVGKILQEKA